MPKENTKFRLGAYDASQLQLAAALIARCAVGGLTADTAKHVLSSIVTGPEAVALLWSSDTLAGVALSIDGCEAEGNAAELSVFCEHSPSEFGPRLLRWGIERARAVNRSRVDVPRWVGRPLDVDILVSEGFCLGHLMFNMKREESAPMPRAPRLALPVGWRWVPASERLARGYYETVRSAWRGLKSAFVTPFEQFRARLNAAEITPMLLVTWDPDNPVAGFSRVQKNGDGSGEVSAVGRHAKFRGLGLGEHLLAKALEQLAAHEVTDIVLEVAANNAAGLSLYRSFHFEVTSEMEVYSRLLES